MSDERTTTDQRVAAWCDDYPDDQSRLFELMRLVDDLIYDGDVAMRNNAAGGPRLSWHEQYLKPGKLNAAALPALREAFVALSLEYLEPRPVAGELEAGR